MQAEIPRSRTDDPATSHAAASRARRFLDDHHSRIVGVLGIPGTIYDIARRTGMDHVAVARRMSELVASGRIMDTGRTAPSPSGRECTVYDQVTHG